MTPAEVAEAEAMERVRPQLERIANDVGTGRLASPQAVRSAVDKLLRGLPDDSLATLEWSYGPPLADWLGDEEPIEDDAADWDIRGLIARHVPTFLAGDPKVGKTMIMESWGIALAMGAADWCGFTIYGRKRVLLMPREDGERTSKSRLWQLARGAGLDRPHDLREWLSVDPTSPLNLVDRGHVDRLRDACGRFDVVMVDSFTTAHLGDENSARDIAKAMEPVRELSISTKTSIVLVHHYNGKGHSDDRGVKHRLRGSSALAGYARHIVGVSHGPQRGQLEVATDGNLEHQIEPSLVELVDGETPHGKKTLAYSFVGLAAEASTDSALRACVVEAVRASAEGFPNANAICAAVGRNRQLVLATVRKELEPDGQLEKRSGRIYCKEVVPGTGGNRREPRSGAPQRGSGSRPYGAEPGTAGSHIDGQQQRQFRDLIVASYATKPDPAEARADDRAPWESNDSTGGAL